MTDNLKSVFGGPAAIADNFTTHSAVLQDSDNKRNVEKREGVERREGKGKKLALHLLLTCLTMSFIGSSHA